MAYLTQLHDNLDKASDQHEALAAVFEEFANFVKDCIQTPSIADHTITAALHLDHGLFTTKFAGRIVSFVFTSSLEKSGNLIGNVTCYLKKEFPEPKQIEFGGFTFDEQGYTNINVPNSNETIHIANDLGTLLMAFHFIHDSLSQ
ncbi:MAG: hypothetical protein ABL933_01035 [Methyloglobulus sp.]|nr:hypothetical protein [Methyloglobulus sp.]